MMTQRAAFKKLPSPSSEAADCLRELFILHRHEPAALLLEAIDLITERDKSPALSSPLIFAARAHRADLIEPLIQRGFDVNQTDPSGCYPLYASVDSMHDTSDPACVVELLRLGADWRPLRGNGESALSLALKNRPTAVRALFSYGVSFETQDIHGNPPLCSVALCNDQTPEEALATLKILLELGAPVDSKNAHQKTALFCACQRASAPLVEALIHAGADVNAPSLDGYAPLLATLVSPVSDKHNHKARIVAMLLSAGADPDLKNDHGQSALSLAKALIGSPFSNLATSSLLAWDQARELERSINPPTLRGSSKAAL